MAIGSADQHGRVNIVWCGISAAIARLALRSLRLDLSQVPARTINARGEEAAKHGQVSKSFGLCGDTGREPGIVRGHDKLAFKAISAFLEELNYPD
jgi:hypothetical protein